MLSVITGVSFVDCYARRHLLDLDGIQVPVIDLADLKKNKTASGRAKDLADVEQLNKAKPTDAD